jgi:hypothetical protein
MHTGVCDDDIKSAQFAYGGVDRGGHPLGVTDVGGRSHAPSTSVTHQRCGALQSIGEFDGVESDHIRTLVSEPLAVHASRPLGGTGDDDHLVDESRHHGAFANSNPL